MENVTKNNLDLWLEARGIFTTMLNTLKESDLKKKMAPSENSIGYLVRHICDMEMIFVKNAFNPAFENNPITVNEKKDTGVWTNLNELRSYSDKSFESLKSELEKTSNEEWAKVFPSQKLGNKSKAELLAHMVSHTAHHSGQIAMIIKYGK
jgi:uncharacterized damage-inducible protein DinB